MRNHGTGTVIDYPYWWGDETYSGKLVPYNELPQSGVGAIVAAAIREELFENGYSDDVSFSGFGGKACMNCGRQRPEVSENGGWCDACSSGQV